MNTVLYKVIKTCIEVGHEKSQTILGKLGKHEPPSNAMIQPLVFDGIQIKMFNLLSSNTKCTAAM